MYIVKKDASESGSRPGLQSWSNPDNIPEGYYGVKDDTDTSVFYQYKGFVNLTVENGWVTSFTGNEEAYQKWEKEHPYVSEPDPEPTTEEVLNALLGG